MTSPDASAPPRTFSRPIFWLGAAGLLVSLVAAGLLCAEQLDFVNAPGCGDDSPCAAATSSRWGKIPGLDWPLSFLGLAYFAALAAAWVVAKRGGGVPAAIKHLIRTGGVVSVILIAAMVVGGYLCPYCLAVHVGNFAILAATELAPRGAGAGESLFWGAIAFGLVSAAQVGLLVAAKGQVEQQLRESTEEIIAARDGPVFTGRYLDGPENAAIRLVIFSDYQCPDCQRIEQQARDVLAQRDDVSFSAKHFPLCMDCNPNVAQNKHPNACWAARAVEAAGILRGDEGFMEMHHWLFDRSGFFTNADLKAGLAEMGYDVRQFQTVMQGPETLARIQADIEEAVSLGVHYTPMVFINGVELKGWQAPNALTRAVDTLAATNPTPATAVVDQPASAAQKYIEDWEFSVTRSLPVDERPWRRGPADAAVQVVIWGDYQEPNTASADRCVREILQARDDVSYAFRHYPFNAECNPQTENVRHPLACRAHRAAEAAGILSGEEGYWAMHEWLMDNQASLQRPGSLAAPAQMLDIDPQMLHAVMETPEVSEAIGRDAYAGASVGLRSLPTIFVNGKLMPRWRLGDECMIPKVVEEAASQGAGD
ncbi:MAG: DsbA family protein [Planctomycetota bacterium]|jgi:protein-disulfide isomerase/uncharacterized membrane protein